VNTHLGEILNFNDTVLGYDMEQANISELEGYKATDLNLPDVVLVKKTFPKLRRRQKKRFWKLKHFEDADKNMDDGGLEPEEN
jgi:nonsense-mediated mRNA decay protein 3